MIRLPGAIRRLQERAELHNNHSFSKGKNGFKISPRMQELMVFAGQMDCYESCNEVIDKFLDIEVSSSQVHKVTDIYGKEIGKTVNEHTTLTPVKKDEVLYTEADGLPEIWNI